MKNLKPIYRKIVVKVGSNVITGKDGELDLEILQSLTAQIAQLQKKGIQIILVSSGAVSAGRSVIKPCGTLTPVAARQILASTGQIKLISTYNELFLKPSKISSMGAHQRQLFLYRQHKEV